MPNITLAISDELHKKLRTHNEIRWSEVIRKILEKRLEDLETFDKVASKSKFTEKDLENIGEKIKEGIAKRHGIKWDSSWIQI